MSLQVIIENLDHGYLWLNNKYVINSMSVTDEEGFTLKFDDCIGIFQEHDGKYEIGPGIDKGERKRIALTFFAFRDIKSIIIKVKGYEGCIEIPLGE